jgi:hypothetical protein
MADFLQPQQNPYADRITEILQKRAQPYNTEQIGLAGESSRLRALAGEDKSVDQILEAIVRKPQQQQVEDSTMLYNMFEQQRANGDKQAEALAKRMEMFTGGDPEGNAIFLQELQNDPENIDPNNAFQVMTKLAGIAKKTGYKPLDAQLKRAQIGAANALATQRASGGGGGNSVFSQTMDAIDADPELSKLSTIDKIRLAQNRVGTDLTISANGEVNAMEGAATGRGELKFAERLGTDRGKYMAAGEQGLQKLQSRVASSTDSSNRVISKIEQVESRVGSNTAGLGGVLLSKLPATEARDVQRDLQTIKANMGFDELQEMRENSPTGGALGPVAVQEIEFLQSVVASLDQDQSVEQFRRNLGEAKAAIKQSNQRITEAYNRDVERFGQQIMPTVGVPNTAPKIPMPGNGWSAEEVQ